MKGPLVPPGAYQVQLQSGDQIYTQSFAVLKDPRLTTSQEDLQQQFDLLQAIRAKISEVHEAINTVRSIRRQGRRMGAAYRGTGYPRVAGYPRKIAQRQTFSYRGRTYSAQGERPDGHPV